MNNIVRRPDETAIRIMGSELPAPVVSYLNDKNLWRLQAPYSLTLCGHRIRIPAGFEFDLASVPRLLWWLIAPFELSITAPLLHDFLYQNAGDPPEGTVIPPRTYSRAETDRLFLQVMRREGVPAWRRQLAYLATRLFGSFWWGA